MKLSDKAARAALLRLAAGNCPLEGAFDIVKEGRLVRELTARGFVREYYGWRCIGWGGHIVTDTGLKFARS